MSFSRQHKTEQAHSTAQDAHGTSPSEGADTPKDTHAPDAKGKPEGSSIKADKNLDSETIGLFSGRSAEARAYNLSRTTKARRLAEILRIVSHYKVASGITPRQMRLMLEELGPTFVKAGQILSMRSEILPEAFCSELSMLRTDAEPMSYAEVLATLRSEYDRPLEELFDAIDPKPLGSASIAQVHMARLLDGTDVAVKVQRPGVRETMAQDVAIMRSLARRAHYFIDTSQFIDVQSVLDELWTSFREETDFLIEAKNLAEFSENNAHVAYIDCPKPYMELCTSHVVVMDYVYGTPITDTQVLEELGYDLEEIGTKLVENYTVQILDDGFFHADPHPGNLLVAEGKIVFLDLGMMGRLTAHYQRQLKNMMVAVAKNDTAGLKDGLLGFVTNTDLSHIDHGAMLQDLDSIVQEFGSRQLSELDLSAFVTSVVNLAGRYGCELPGAVTMLARSLVTLEGVLEQAMPTVSMVEIVQRHLLGSRTQLDCLGSEADELLKESLRATHSLLGAASESQQAMRMLTRGQLSLGLRFAHTEDPISDLARAGDRLSLAIVVAGLFIGSSVLYYARIKPVIFGIPVIGFVGYLIALGLGLWIVRQIMRDSKRK